MRTHKNPLTGIILVKHKLQFIHLLTYFGVEALR